MIKLYHSQSLKSIIILLFFFSCKKIERHERHEKPNVVFIICDDLNDYVGTFGGHPQSITPNIDSLANYGIKFINAQSNIPVCSPSRNSLLTGVYPHDSKDFGWTPRAKQKVLKNNKTFLTLLKENGYYLAGSGKIAHKHESEPWDEWGTEVKHNYGPFVFNGKEMVAHPEVPAPFREIGSIDGSYGPFFSRSRYKIASNSPIWVKGPNEEPFKYISADDRDLTNDEKHAEFAVRKIRRFEEKNMTQPFFIGIGFVRPHTPLHAPKKYFDMFPIEQLKLEDWKENDEYDTWYNQNNPSSMKGLRYYKTLLESYDGDRELALKNFLQAYLACITFVDEQIGKVIGAIKNSKFRDNTIIILTSDHGWQMGEKSYLFKNSGWEESCRIPLIISTPNSKHGSVKQPVSLIDIFPTLIDYCGLIGGNKLNEKGADLGGHSLRPLLEDPENGIWLGPKGALSVIGNYAEVRDSTLQGQNFSYRTANWRYIRYNDKSEELYNHKNDIYEWNNLVKDKNYQGVLARLRSDLNELVFKKM